MAKAKATIDHATIKRWVEERGGGPAHVKGSGASGDDPGILRIDYPGYGGKETLEAISWDEFFRVFEDNQLAFLYQDEGDSRFSKLVARDSAELEAGGGDDGRRKPRRARGGTDALELLEGQHREVEALFEKLESARSDSQKERIFLKIANALAAHTKIEETLFYPAVFVEDTEDELREAVEEHLVAKRLIVDLLDMEPDHPQFMAKATVLKEIIEHHVEDEEEDLFPQVRADAPTDLDELGARMKKLHRELMHGEPKDAVPEEIDEAVAQFPA